MRRSQMGSLFFFNQELFFILPDSGITESGRSFFEDSCHGSDFIYVWDSVTTMALPSKVAFIRKFSRGGLAGKHEHIPDLV